MQVDTIYTFKSYLYNVTSGFLLQNKVEICLISWGRFFIKQLLLVPMSLSFEHLRTLQWSFYPYKTVREVWTIKVILIEL